jgi:sarcosine oxidase gamma subunit
LRATKFKAGHALRSQLGHMPLHITHLKSGGFRLLSFRSMAGTMVHEIQRAMDHLAARA